MSKHNEHLYSKAFVNSGIKAMLSISLPHIFSCNVCIVLPNRKRTRDRECERKWKRKRDCVFKHCIAHALCYFRNCFSPVHLYYCHCLCSHSCSRSICLSISHLLSRSLHLYHAITSLFSALNIMLSLPCFIASLSIFLKAKKSSDFSELICTLLVSFHLLSTMSLAQFASVHHTLHFFLFSRCFALLCSLAPFTFLLLFQHRYVCLCLCNVYL